MILSLSAMENWFFTIILVFHSPDFLINIQPWKIPPFFYNFFRVSWEEFTLFPISIHIWKYYENLSFQTKMYVFVTRTTNYLYTKVTFKCDIFIFYIMCTCILSKEIWKGYFGKRLCIVRLSLIRSSSMELNENFK